MCFSLQRRAIFQHRNFKKWSEHAVFCTFWLQNVLLATAACDFSTSQLQKVVRTCSVLYILTSKCASRYSGVQFFMSPLNSYLRTRRFTEVTFRPSRHTNHWKTQHFATSLTFRACGSSFFPHLLIFFLAALLFQLSILSEVRLLNFLRLRCNRYVVLRWAANVANSPINTKDHVKQGSHKMHAKNLEIRKSKGRWSQCATAPWNPPVADLKDFETDGLSDMEVTKWQWNVGRSKYLQTLRELKRLTTNTDKYNIFVAKKYPTKCHWNPQKTCPLVPEFEQGERRNPQAGRPDLHHLANNV